MDKLRQSMLISQFAIALLSSWSYLFRLAPVRTIGPLNILRKR